jgi:serine/threonine protein kinase
MKDLKEAASSPEFRNNRPEGNACLVLAHPNIVKIVYHRLDHPKPFLVTEYCEGGALNRDQILGLPLVQKLEMFSKICSAVGFAHNRGIIHRDLKPGNIFLQADQKTPVVGDFGLCLMVDDERVTELSEAVGARYYMAPELEDGKYEDVTPAADVYTLGKILYWFLTGKTFAREKHREKSFDLTAGSQDPEIFMIYEMIDGICAVDPEKRIYQSGNEVAAEASNIIKRINMGANVVDLKAPQRCIYCGMGFYKSIYSTHAPAKNSVPIDFIRFLGSLTPCFRHEDPARGAGHTVSQSARLHMVQPDGWDPDSRAQTAARRVQAQVEETDDKKLGSVVLVKRWRIAAL